MKIKEEIARTSTHAAAHNQVQVHQRDGHVELVLNETFLFDSGRANLLTNNGGVLDHVIDVVRNLPATTKVVVEGHTDDVPIHNADFDSNWQLAAARGLAVIQAFQQRGFPGDRISLVAHGEYKPLAPNRDDDGHPVVDNQRKNRRVVIKII